MKTNNNDDLVQRLRAPFLKLLNVSGLCNEAADEIERLRKEHKLLRDDWEKLVGMHTLGLAK